VVSNFIRQALAGESITLYGDGSQTRSFCYVDDMIDGLIRMMDNPDAVGQSFNLVGDPMMSARDYFDAIHEALGARITVSPGSLHALWLADGVKSFALQRNADSGFIEFQLTIADSSQVTPLRDCSDSYYPG
jgi:nucleoside-diphosphate-sugar epimerase